MSTKKKNTALTDQEVDDILHKDIIELLGITELSEKEKEEFRDKAVQAIENRAYAKILKILEKKKKLKEYKEAKDIDKFFEEEGIDLDVIFAEAAIAYKLEMKSFSKVIDDNLIKQKAKGGD